MGERVLRVVQSFLGGVIMSFVVTVVHGEWFPWIAVAGILVVACYSIGLRLVTSDRLVCVAGTLGVVITVFVLAQRSPGGSILIAATDAGNLWVIGSSLVCGLAAAWPDLRRAEQS